MDWLPGVTGLVTFGGEPADVSKNLIDAIRQQVNNVNQTGGLTVNGFKQGEIIIIFG